MVFFIDLISFKISLISKLYVSPLDDQILPMNVVGV